MHANEMPDVTSNFKLKTRPWNVRSVLCELMEREVDEEVRRIAKEEGFDLEGTAISLMPPKQEDFTYDDDSSFSAGSPAPDDEHPPSNEESLLTIAEKERRRAAYLAFSKFNTQAVNNIVARLAENNRPALDKLYKVVEEWNLRGPDRPIQKKCVSRFLATPILTPSLQNGAS